MWDFFEASWHRKQLIRHTYGLRKAWTKGLEADAVLTPGTLLHKSRVHLISEVVLIHTLVVLLAKLVRQQLTGSGLHDWIGTASPHAVWWRLRAYTSSLVIQIILEIEVPAHTKKSSPPVLDPEGHDRLLYCDVALRRSGMLLPSCETDQCQGGLKASSLHLTSQKSQKQTMPPLAPLTTRVVKMQRSWHCLIGEYCMLAASVCAHCDAYNPC